MKNKTMSCPHPRQPRFFNRKASDERPYYKGAGVLVRVDLVAGVVVNSYLPN